MNQNWEIAVIDRRQNSTSGYVCHETLVGSPTHTLVGVRGGQVRVVFAFVRDWNSFLREVQSPEMSRPRRMVNHARFCFSPPKVVDENPPAGA